MKAVLLTILWCAEVFLILLILYKIIPPEMQYVLAEHFGVYGDELVMDFVLYVFFGTAILAASVFTLAIYRISRK